MKKIFFLVMLSVAEPTFSQRDFVTNFSSIHLTTLEQKIFSCDEIKKNAASVFVFLLPDCPACESYSLTLSKLEEKYKASGVRFYGVFPGHYNTAEEMKSFQSRYHIHFLLMTDPDKKLVSSLGAKVAPEVFVVGADAKTIYRGRIDDWMYAVGKKKPVISSHELEDALNAWTHHHPVKVSETNAIGCIIE